MAETTDIEKKSLEAHVELCAQRYNALEQSIDGVRQDTAELKTTIQEVHRLVHKMSDNRNSQLIGWGIGVIGFLTAALGYLITNYVLK
jgi:phage shock protein A